MAKALLFPEGDIAINSPRHVIIDILDRALNGIVWSRLPEADSELTGKDHFVAVTKVSDTLSGRACCNTAYRMVVDVQLYERRDCAVPGFFKSLDIMITSILQSTNGTFGNIQLTNIIRQTATPLPYVDDDFRAESISFALDYEVKI